MGNKMTNPKSAFDKTVEDAGHYALVGHVEETAPMHSFLRDSADCPRLLSSAIFFIYAPEDALAQKGDWSQAAQWNNLRVMLINLINAAHQRVEDSPHKYIMRIGYECQNLDIRYMGTVYQVAEGVIHA